MEILIEFDSVLNFCQGPKSYRDCCFSYALNLAMVKCSDLARDHSWFFCAARYWTLSWVWMRVILYLMNLC